MSPKIFWLISLLSPLPLAGHYFYSLYQQQKLSLALMAILLVSGLFIMRWNRQWHYPVTWISGLLYLLALILLGTSIAIWSPWLATSSLLVLAASFLASHTELFHSEKRHRISRRSLLYLSIPLLLVMRLPLGWEDTFQSEYLQYTTRVSSFWLDSLNIPHYLTQQLLELPRHRIDVVPVSGSYQTLLTMILIGAVLYAWFARPIFVAPCYLLVGLILGGVLQTVRLTMAAVALDRFGFDVTEGTRLAMFQWLSLVGMLALFYSFDALITFLFAPVSSDTIHVAESNLRNPLKTIWNRLLRRSKSRRRSSSQRVATIPAFVLFPLYSLLIISFGIQLFLSFGAIV